MNSKRNFDQEASTQILFELMKKFTYLGNTNNNFILSIQNPVLSISLGARILCVLGKGFLEMTSNLILCTLVSFPFTFAKRMVIVYCSCLCNEPQILACDRYNFFLFNA